MIVLKAVCLQAEAGRLREPENQVHVLHSLSGSSFHEIVYHADYMEIVPVLADIQHAFVRIGHHLDIRRNVRHRDKRLGIIIILVQVHRLIPGETGLHIG